MKEVRIRLKYVALIVWALVIASCGNDKTIIAEPKSFLLERLPMEKTGIDFINLVPEDAEHSIINYIYYYNGGGVAVGDVNNDSMPDLYFVANKKANKLYINKGNLTFEEAKEAGVEGNSSWNTGVTMVDINSDGMLDIYVCAVSGLLDFEGKNELFVNNGDGTFTERAEEFGLDFQGYATQAYFFDFDKDDDLDVYIVNHAVHTTRSHGDANLRKKRVENVGDVLLKNENGVFKDVSESANIYGGVNGYGLSASIADFNNDGWDDIYVCNDFHEDDYYYLNNQDGTFTEKLGEVFSVTSRFSMGSDAGDLNRDGYQDLITLDMLPKEEKILKETEGDDSMFNMQEQLRSLGYKDQYSRNMLQINNTGRYFNEAAIVNNMANTDWSWAPLIADFNNDSYQDVFISNGILRRPNGLDFIKYVSNAFRGRSEKEGLQWLYNSIGEMPSGITANEIFEGNAKEFANKTGEWIENRPQLSNGTVYADLDLDGDLDLVVNNFGATAVVYENTTGASNNSITLQFEYKPGNLNGIGTKVNVFANGQRQMKQLFLSRGFISSVEPKLHFGLGEETSIDSIQVIWPNNTYRTIKNPEANSTLTIAYDPLAKKYEYRNQNLEQKVFSKIKAIDFTHTEDRYTDFKQDKLIPYKISNLGPAVAVGDVDQNGYDDIFIGGASGKRGRMYFNNGDRFEESAVPIIARDSLFEDNTAVFADLDGDKDLDLYVGSGIHKDRDKTYEVDRVYFNVNGRFVPSDKSLPIDSLVTTTVNPFDYDNDGDVDLFVGNLADADNFGASVKSYLLKNDGNGNFTIDSNFELIAKVNDAVWQDIDSDGQKDLLVALEWETPQVYKNSNGVLKPISIPDNINGLWQAINTFDIDKDGDQDIILGNWGTNTKFSLNFDGPLVMYHSDFDKNGKTETLLAYNRDGKYYPLNSKSEMGSQMTIINKLYVEHKDYAGKTIEEIIKQGTIADATKFKVDVLASGYLENVEGQFKEFKEFPTAFQLAPITDFSVIKVEGEEQLLVGGNSNRVNTYHGKYLSLKGLLVKDMNEYSEVSKLGMDPLHTQIKALHSVDVKDGQILFVVSNNDTLETYFYTTK